MRIRMTRMIATGGLAGLMAAAFVGTAHADPEALIAAPSVPACDAVVPGSPIIVPNDFLPALSDTRSAGHFQLSGTALDVWTDDSSSQAKVAEYIAVAPTPLGAVGEPSLDWDGIGIPPGFQLVVDLDGNSTPDGILVGETVYGGRWWANNTLIAFIGASVPPAVVSPGGDGSAVAGTLSAWLGAYPSAQVRSIGFSLGSGVKGDGTINSMTFGCVERAFAAAPPATPLEFSQTEFFGSTVAGSTATASYLISSGPTGQSADDGAVIIGIDYVTAAELASCTVAVDGGPAAPVEIEYDPTIDDVLYSGALVYVASGLVIEPGFSLGIDVVCQTTSGAVLGDYDLFAAFSYGNSGGGDGTETRSLAVVEPGTVGSLADVLSIVAPVVVTTAPTTTAPAPAPTTSALLAATGPADATGSLRLGLVVLLAGIALVGAGAVRRTGPARQH